MYATITHISESLRKFLSTLPKIITDIRKAPEKALLKKHVHNIVDEAIDCYGEFYLNLCKSVDPNLISYIMHDVASLIVKYKEPVSRMTVAMVESYKISLEEFNKKTTKDSNSLGKIFEALDKKHKWTDNLNK